MAKKYVSRGSAALMTEALRRAALDVETRGPDRGMRKLDLIARRIVQLAVDGDLAAAHLIGDRLEGRPLQRIEADGAAGLAIGFAELLARVNEERRLKAAIVIDADVSDTERCLTLPAAAGPSA